MDGGARWGPAIGRTSFFMSEPESTTLGVDIRVAKDRLAAWIIIKPGAGAGVMPSDVVTAAAMKDVMVTEEVEARIVDALRDHVPVDETTEYEIAQATPPQRGDDATIRWRPGFLPDAVADDDDEEVEDADEAAGDHPPVDPEAEDGVDFYNQNTDTRTVSVGDVVGDVTHATLGVDGLDVCGGPLEARPGRDLTIELCPRSLVVEDDSVVALTAGKLRAGRRAASIDRVMELAGDVDFNSGNIDFGGAVIVRGGVKDRFVVRALGDVAVSGLVEGATMLVGGRFDLHRGMAAKERGQIMVDGDCETGYFNYVRGRVAGDLHVRRELMECELVVGGDLLCGGGTAVGGSYVITGTARFSTLGSGAGVPTRIVIGEVPVHARRLRRLNEMIDTLSREIDSEHVQLRDLEHMDGIDEQTLEPLREVQAERLRRYDAMDHKRLDLSRTIKRSRTFSLTVRRRICHGVCLSIRGRDYFFDDTTNGPIEVRMGRSDQPEVRVRGRDPQPLTDIARLSFAIRTDLSDAA